MNFSSKRNKENNMDVIKFEGEVDFTVWLGSTHLHSVGFKYFYLIQIILFNINQLFALSQMASSIVNDRIVLMGP